MGSSSFSLQSSVLCEAFRLRLSDQLFSDLKIRTGDGLEVRAHRLVLGAASSTLRKALLEVGEDQFAVLVLPDFTMEDLESIFPFLYGGCEPDTRQPVPNSSLLECLRIGLWDNKNYVQLQQIKEEVVNIDTLYLRNDFEENYLDFEDVEDLKEETSFERRKKSDILVEEIWECIKCGQSMSKNFFLENHFEKCCAAGLSVQGQDKNDEEEEMLIRKGRKRKYCEVDGGWKCLNCEAVFSEKSRLKNHNDVCGQTSFKCGQCQTTFDDIELLKEHLAKSEVCSEKKATFICDLCPRVFYDQKKFDNHQVRHQSSFDCQFCESTFSDFDKFSRHVRHVHRPDHDRPFLCKICPKSFDYEKNLSNHLKSHDLPPKTEFCCGKCDKVFGSKSTLHYHSQKHSTPTHQCSACPRMFKSARGLRYHMSLHDGVADFLCHDCGKGFVTRQKLVNHRRSKHTFEKPFICEQCGQGFIRSDKLVVHKRRAHTGEKPYQCEVCEWRGVDSSSLIHHRKKHANEAARRIGANPSDDVRAGIKTSENESKDEIAIESQRPVQVVSMADQNFNS